MFVLQLHSTRDRKPCLFLSIFQFAQLIVPYLILFSECSSVLFFFLHRLDFCFFSAEASGLGSDFPHTGHKETVPTRYSAPQWGQYFIDDLLLHQNGWTLTCPPSHANTITHFFSCGVLIFSFFIPSFFQLFSGLFPVVFWRILTGYRKRWLASTDASHKTVIGL